MLSMKVYDLILKGVSNLRKNLKFSLSTPATFDQIQGSYFKYYRIQSYNQLQSLAQQIKLGQKGSITSSKCNKQFTLSYSYPHKYSTNFSSWRAMAVKPVEGVQMLSVYYQHHARTDPHTCTLIKIQTKNDSSVIRK